MICCPLFYAYAVAQENLETFSRLERFKDMGNGTVLDRERYDQKIRGDDHTYKTVGNWESQGVRINTVSFQDKRKGDRYLKVVRENSRGKTAQTGLWISTFTPGRMYKVSFFAKSDLASSLDLRFYVHNGESNPLEKDLKLQTKWARFEAYFKADRKAMGLYFLLHGGIGSTVFLHSPMVSPVPFEPLQLMWTKKAVFNGPHYDGGYNWEDANKTAENLVFAGFDDWRLPSKGELATLLEKEKVENRSGKKAYINPIFFEEGFFYWTADKWHIHFNTGQQMGRIPPDYSIFTYVRPVRNYLITKK